MKVNSSCFSPIITSRKNGVKQTAGLRNDIKPFPKKNPKRDVFTPGNGLSIKERSAIYTGAKET